LLAVAVALLGTTVFPPAGSAGTARVLSSFSPQGDGGDELQQRIVFDATPGEQNRLSIRQAGEVETADDFYFLVRVTDSTASVTAGAGCSQEGPHAVLCRYNGLGTNRVRLGDGDDFLERDINGVVADGGRGNDVLWGSSTGDVLDAGPGTDIVYALKGQDVIRDSGGGRGDVLSGGTSPREAGDTLDLSDRRGNLRIDLASGVAGRPGENDRITGVENVVGGMGDDVILGDGNRNVFEERLYDASPEGQSRDYPRRPTGHDRVDGRGGNDLVQSLDGRDIVYGGQGRDRLLCNLAVRDRCRLVGGPGGDELTGGAGADLLRGGPGRDRLFGWKGADRLVGGSGSDAMFGGQGSDRLHARDRTADRVVGGNGRDGARTDRRLDRLTGVERMF